MGRIERYNADPSVGLDTRMAGDMVEREKSKKGKQESIIPPFEELTMPPKLRIPNPPFWGRRVIQR